INDICLENVKNYRYLGVYFSVSGIFSCAQDDIFKKSIKATFKLTKSITSGEPSIRTSLHLFDHMIKPIVLYGSEIWGVFKTQSAACRKDSVFSFENIYKNNVSDKSQIRYLKYILGVNKYTSNLAVLSETGRFPMYFSIILSIVKYLYRFENLSYGLLKQSYEMTKKLHDKGVESWYSSALYILKLLNLNIFACRNLGENQLIYIVKRNLISKYKTFWRQEKDKKVNNGKLDTYFSFKTDFCKEPYLDLQDFHLRKAICKLRISAHSLLIETGRYAKKGSLAREQRICRFCNLNTVESEVHFLTECSLYDDERLELFSKINIINSNFALLNNTDKARWMLLQENQSILWALGFYIHCCFEKRHNTSN
ncbi:MAG: hypothetical protein AB2693_21380, partial [Candidatus Thiodiazotropha sp.]